LIIELYRTGAPVVEVHLWVWRRNVDRQKQFDSYWHIELIPHALTEEARQLFIDWQAIGCGRTQTRDDRMTNGCPAGAGKC
jgi:hypothetical protein